MAVAYASYAFARSSAVATLVINKPSGTATNDLLVAFMRASGGGSWTPPSGWSAGATTARSAIFWRVADGGEGSSFTFTCSSGVGANGGEIVRITGASASAPVASTATTLFASGTTLTIPTTTAAADGSMWLHMLLQNNTAGTFTAPAGTTKTHTEELGTNPSIVSGYKAVNAGATGTADWTSTSGSSSEVASIAINPGSGGGGSPLQTAATLYPINSATVDTGTGIDVRALSDTEPGATDTSQSILNSTQASNAERRWDPANASDTTVVNAATTNDKKGWAIPLDKMDTGDGRCAAVLAAQTVTVNLSGTASGTGTGTGNDVLTPRASLWRYNVVTDAATLIAGATGTAVTLSALLAYSGTAWSGSAAITVAAPVTFAANEVLMVVAGGNLACGAGLLSAARTTTWILNVDVSTTSAVCGTTGLRKQCAQAATGAVVPAAVVIRRPTKALVSSITPTSTVTRFPSLHFASAIVPAGAVIRQPRRFFTGTITPGPHALTRQPVKVLESAITPGPHALTRQPVKVLLADITPTSIVAKVIARYFTGTVTPTGTALKTPTKYMVSELTPGPHVVIRQPVKLLESEVEPTGTIRSLLTKNLRSDLPLEGAVVRLVTKYYTGSLVPSGAVLKTPKKFLTGLISGEGGAPSIVRRFFED